MSRCGMLLVLAADALASNASSGILCGGAAVVEASDDWLWSHNAVPSPSCTSPPVENVAEMCKGDPTSVVIRGNGQAQCLSAQMPDCTFDMREVEQLDFDINMLGCRGTWAAPLWMTPNRWLGGGDSGEIDMLENCPTDVLASNFAGGGNQVSWPFADTDSFQGHTTMWKQADGDGVMSIYVKTCNTYELDSNGACPETGDVAYLHDIYGKNGCSNGGDCIYTLVSDIWNGLSGDAGYWGCAGGQAHYSAGCSVSVASIRFKASSGTFSGKCSALVSNTPSPGPAPAPSPEPAPTPSPAPAPTPSPGVWQPCADGICCSPYTPTPQYCPDGEQCQECGGGSACQCPGSLGAVVV